MTKLALLLLLILAGCKSAPVQTEGLSAYKTQKPRTSFELGSKAIKDKDPTLAIAELSYCLRKDPKNASCHWELGWAHFLNNDYVRAAEEWKKVQTLNSKYQGLDVVQDKIKKHLEFYQKAKALNRTAPATFERRHKTSSATLKIRAVGDTMLGSDFPERDLPPEGFSPLLYALDMLDGADAKFANYEGTLCTGETSTKCENSKGNCYAFRTPKELGVHLVDAGFNLISLANNHILDFGEGCRKQTEETLDALGIPWSGRTGTVARVEKKAFKISMIAFHSALHTNSTLDVESAAKLIRQEKDAGRLVIVSFHGGAEGVAALHVPKKMERYFGEERGDVLKFAHAAVDAGADLVLGSGPHVVRAMEIYKDRLIAYSLGNFATYKAFNLWGFNGIGLVLDAEMDSTGKFVSGSIIPTRQLDFGLPIYDERGMATDLIRLLSLQDFPHTGVMVAKDGTLRRRVSR